MILHAYLNPGYSLHHQHPRRRRVIVIIAVADVNNFQLIYRKDKALIYLFI